jgi:hypothetical protein
MIGKMSRASANLKHGRRQCEDGRLLHSDRALARNDQHIDDDSNVEESHSFERHQAREPRLGFILEVLRDEAVNRLHQTLECAEEYAHVDPGLAVDEAQAHALGGIRFP